MQESAPHLIAVNVNHWLRQQGDRTHVLRTMGNQARAFLGGGYEIIDHDQVLVALMTELEKFSEEESKSLFLNDFCFFLKKDKLPKYRYCLGVLVLTDWYFTDKQIEFIK